MAGLVGIKHYSGDLGDPVHQGFVGEEHLLGPDGLFDMTADVFQKIIHGFHYLMGVTS